jgi:hypothetical protein
MVPKLNPSSSLLIAAKQFHLLNPLVKLQALPTNSKYDPHPHTPKPQIVVKRNWKAAGQLVYD